METVEFPTFERLLKFMPAAVATMLIAWGAIWYCMKIYREAYKAGRDSNQDFIDWLKKHFEKHDK